MNASSGTEAVLVLVVLLLESALPRKPSASSPTSDTSFAGLQLRISPAVACAAAAAAARFGLFAGVAAAPTAAAPPGLQLPLRLLLVLLATLEPNSRLLAPTPFLSWML
jgi:hypothetical protein